MAAGVGAQEYRRLLAFAVVGTLGFLVDAGVVLGLTGSGVDALSAQAAAFVAAVTVTWLGNRSWTFRDRVGRSSLSGEWARYVSANVVGWVVNNGVYALLVLTVPLTMREPVWAVAAGSLAGLAFNYTAARRVVFS
ncbi:MAG: GtrA family protein [Acidiferrobacter thiooxydans]|uniref:GtrA family protein n=1 Tax=Acidiferrobacter sp. SPIII_3 TaxID=1281578 RepID=UPI000D73D452|nr:GtrA family protein [Acidiferrobacter sp. SPIII_3]AWP21983.1 GtrA family protein [Acidiferrobacter sp. SPIII_3]